MNNTQENLNCATNPTIPWIDWLPHVSQAVTNVVQSADSQNSTLILTAASAAVQDVYDVMTPMGTLIPTSLFSIIVAQSGLRKSSAEKIINQAIVQYQGQKFEQSKMAQLEYNSMMERFAIKHKILKRSVSKAIEKGDKLKEEACFRQLEELSASLSPPPPTGKIIYQEATIQALLYGMSKSNKGAYLSSGEGAALLAKMNPAALAFLNDLWSGGDVIVDRKSEASFRLTNKRLTTSIMIQETAFQDFLNKSNGAAVDTGFLSRPLLVRPHSNMGTRFYNGQPNQVDLDNISWFHNRTLSLLEQAEALNGNRKTLHFDSIASPMLIQYYNQIETEMRPSGQLASILGYASKAVENTIRICAVLHAFSGVDSEFISADTTQKAIEISRCFIGEYLSLMGVKTIAQLQFEYGQLLFDWLKRQNLPHPHMVLRSVVLKNGPSKLRNTRDLEMAIQSLHSEGLIVFYPSPRKACLQLTSNFFSTTYRYSNVRL